MWLHGSLIGFFSWVRCRLFRGLTQVLLRFYLGFTQVLGCLNMTHFNNRYTRVYPKKFALSWFPYSHSSQLPVIFQLSLPWHQYTLDHDIRVLRSLRKTRPKFAPLRSRQQPPWRHCCFQITSVVVHISFSEANSNPRVLGQENKGEAEVFHSHTLLMTSEFWLGALSCISSTPDVSLWRHLALIALRRFFVCYP